MGLEESMKDEGGEVVVAKRKFGTGFGDCIDCGELENWRVREKEDNDHLRRNFNRPTVLLRPSSHPVARGMRHLISMTRIRRFHDPG